MTALRQTWQVSLRYLRVIVRQLVFLFIALVQPIIWLLLFGALFKAVTEIPGFAGGSYIDFLTPGVVVMLAVSSAARAARPSPPASSTWIVSPCSSLLSASGVPPATIRPRSTIASCEASRSASSR